MYDPEGKLISPTIQSKEIAFQHHSYCAAPKWFKIVVQLNMAGSESDRCEACLSTVDGSLTQIIGLPDMFATKHPNSNPEGRSLLCVQSLTLGCILEVIVVGPTFMIYSGVGDFCSWSTHDCFLQNPTVR